MAIEMLCKAVQSCDYVYCCLRQDYMYIVHVHAGSRQADAAALRRMVSRTVQQREM